MNKLFTFLFLSVLLSCNNADNINKKKLINDPHEKKEGNQVLALNNGAKWQADSSTSNNVLYLQSVIQQFYSNGNNELPAYKLAAGKLQLGLDKMVKECKMKGPEHDALHLWLVPLMQEVKELNSAMTLEDATKKMAAIDQQVNRFTQFFK